MKQYRTIEQMCSDAHSITLKSKKNIYDIFQIHFYLFIMFKTSASLLFCAVHQTFCTVNTVNECTLRNLQGKKSWVRKLSALLNYKYKLKITKHFRGFPIPRLRHVHMISYYTHVLRRKRYRAKPSWIQLYWYVDCVEIIPWTFLDYDCIDCFQK